MKTTNRILILCTTLAFAITLSGCHSDTSETRDRAIVNEQQRIYQETQPVHIYDYSIPRDVYQQIYDIITTQAVATYTVVATMGTGATRYRCPSIGYPIPADSSLTNPMQGATAVDNMGADPYEVAIEQAEPNGLFSSKNTDGTWILCVDLGTSEAYGYYTEHKTDTWPFIVEQDETGEWQRADNKPIAFKVEIREDAPPPRVPS